MCNGLGQLGFLNTETIGPQTNDPLDSSVIVATPGVRDQFGPQLASVYAPVILASFGSGNARIDIREVIPGGTEHACITRTWRRT